MKSIKFIRPIKRSLENLIITSLNLLNDITNKTNLNLLIF